MQGREEGGERFTRVEYYHRETIINSEQFAGSTRTIKGGGEGDRCHRCR